MTRRPCIALQAALMLVIFLLNACGGTEVDRERSLVVAGEPPTRTAGDAARHNTVRGGVRIAIVTHGQASSPFWAIVRNGVEAAARQMDVLVDYKAPDTYSLDRMRELIDREIASKPDGLVVSLPELGVAPAIERAIRAGIPVVSINSGSDVANRLGVLAHVGQPEDRAGFRAGQRLARAGARTVLCLNQQPGNQGLDARCLGMTRAMRTVGGRATVFDIDDQDPATPDKIAAIAEAQHADALLALNATGGRLAVQAVRDAHLEDVVKVATFDLTPDVLAYVKSGALLFAVDQQAYLQGYLPIVFLAQRARYGLFPAQGDVVATGPNFVTKANADKALELSKRSIR